MDAIKKKLRDPRLTLIAAPLLLLSPIYLTGKAIFWGTAATQFVPWWDFAWKSILAGELPLWNPLLGMGAPLVANYQSALFYPPTWIYFFLYLLGGVRWMAWGISLLVCGHLIWAGLGVAALLKELKVNRLGQTVGGLAYGLSGYLVARAGFLSMNAAAAWIPWLLVAVYQLSGNRPRSIFKLTAILAMLLFAGHAQTAFYGIVLGGLWGIYWAVVRGSLGGKFRNLGKVLLAYLAAGIWAAGICAVQLLPTAEYLVLSPRSVEYGYEQAMTYSFWPWRFLTMLLPDLFGSPAGGNYWGYGNFWEDAVYIGLLPLLFAVGYLIRALRGKRPPAAENTRSGEASLALFLGILIAGSFLLALGKNTPVFPFLYNNIPGANLFQAPTRITIVAEISLAVLAGLGAGQLTKPAGKGLYVTRLAVAGCLAVIVGALLAKFLLDDLRPTFLNAAAWMGAVGLAAAVLMLLKPEGSEPERNRPWSWAIAGLICLDLIRAGWGLNPGIQSDFYVIEGESKLAGRVWMPAEFEYDLKFNRFFRFDTYHPEQDWRDMHKVLLPNLAQLQGISMVNNFDPLVPGIYQHWMDGINAKYPDLDMLQLMDIGTVVEMSESGQVKLQQVEKTGSPVRLTGCAGIIDPGPDSLDFILESDLDLSGDIWVISDNGVNCQEGGSGKVEIAEIRNGYLKVEVDPGQDSWLFWSQTWYPGWKVKVDGQASGRSYRVNYLFQGAPVPGDAQQVEFIYRPGSIIWGSAISGICLLTGILLSRFKKRIRE